MILSMTGYAVQSSDAGRARLNLELKTVNSRFLDLGFRMAEELRQAEPQLREAIVGRLTRGKVECRLYWQANPGAAVDLAMNGELLQRLEQAQAQLRGRFPDAPALSVGELLRWPGVLGESGPDFDSLLAMAGKLIQSALDELIATRAREGAKLAEMIRERVGKMRELVAQAEPILPAAVAEYQEKLTNRLKEAVATLDEDRVRTEVSLFAQRADVMEEFSRLRTHLDEVERVLKAGGPAGKRLDFLMQELNREANTLASKSISNALSSIAIEMKLIIEQMREQVQNLE
ncbi:YicC/YloC family endoribonuclease [Niveibacterium sp. SC-1]|uniref:YicC/YloC family endoribonuclease n=1 Tax=Niveibacterium sp. SC-1 TaxID=3135646 RepID=UPI00311D3530